MHGREVNWSTIRNRIGGISCKVCFHSHREADCLGEFTTGSASLDLTEQSNFYFVTIFDNLQFWKMRMFVGADDHVT
jgi:hypothetical protein